MKSKLEGKRLEASYRRSIYIVHSGRGHILECVCDNPRTLRKLVSAMRRKNPDRIYETDDPANP